MNDADHFENPMSRRTLMKTGAGGALVGLVASEQLDAAAVSNPRDVYAELGVKKIINAAGTFTALGGSIMPPEVQAAWMAASQNFVDLAQLQDRVGEKIARMLGVEAALVTTGAAGGMVLATAAAITYRDPTRIARLPLSPQEGLEVLRQTSHKACYDRQVASCGVKLVDVETADQLEQAIGPQTVMMLSYNINEPDGKIAREKWLEIARKHRVPTLLDAAADTPPTDSLWKYNKMGYDMVVFSGGKALRGPQNAGLLLGRKDLIQAAKQNTSPNCGTIGRGLKVSKEDMVAMWAAIERFLKLDQSAELHEWERRIEVIEGALKVLPIKTERIVPPIANRVPHLLLHWDEKKLGITSTQLKKELADGELPIATGRVHGTGTDGFLISVFMLQPGEEQIVAERLVKVFQK
jgi:L-seryl-tRNA(Ser) seleniumtransferase